MYVWKATWSVKSEKESLPVEQLVAAKDFQSAFFKTRKWAKENVEGELVSIVKDEGMVA